MEWMLIVYIYAGVWAKGDSVAITSVPMMTEQACNAAGENLGSLVSGSTKEIRFACVKVR